MADAVEAIARLPDSVGAEIARWQRPNGLDIARVRTPIGVIGMIVVSPLLAPLVGVGAFLVPAYNLELAGGRFHSDTWFAVAWGGFPAFTGYFSNALTIRPAGLLLAFACCLLSAAQRRPRPVWIEVAL